MVTSTNPFHFGSPVSDRYFCDRGREVGDLVSFMRGGVHVFVVGPRRYGKTSVVKQAMERFVGDGGRAGYAELIRCTTELEVATEILGAVLNGVLARRRRVRGWLEEVLRHLRVSPTVSVASDGNVSLSFEPHLGTRTWQQVLDDSLAIVRDASREGPVALALDEVQQVASIGPRGMGGTLKHMADHLPGVSLVLSGSHQSVMDTLTKGRSAPLYGMGERMAIDPIPQEEMVAYLRRRARAGDKVLDRATAGAMYERASAVPNFVQQIAFAAYEHAPGDRMDGASVDAGFAAIVARQSSDFAERFEVLADSQKRVLLALAAEPAQRVFTKAFMESVQVANPNAVRKALDVLSRLELVERRGGRYEVANPFLAAWLRDS